MNYTNPINISGSYYINGGSIGISNGVIKPILKNECYLCKKSLPKEELVNIEDQEYQCFECFNILKNLGKNES